MAVKVDYVLSLVEKGKRADGRAFDEFRKAEVEASPIEKAEGSARVKLGKTDVIVGIKLGVGTPFPDRLDEGTIMVNAELSPIATTDFESGPPNEESIELARVVDRGIRESKSIDLKKLVIVPEEKVWSVFIDIHILNHDGNLIDAAGLATITALWNAKLPELDKENNIILETKTKHSLPMANKPIPVTVHKVGGKLMVDPDKDEENSATSRLTITTIENGNVCAMQKGMDALTVEEIVNAFDLSKKAGAELRKLIK